MRRLLAVLVMFSLFATPAIAGSQGSPEIDDDRGDVDVQHLVDSETLSEEEPSADELETSGDVVKAWVDKETEDSFEINVELADIPDDENVSSPLVDVWAHFTIQDGDFHAAASLSSPKSGAPTQGTFGLYLADSKVGELAGTVDTEEDIVSVRVAKADVRDPAEGDQLTDFYVTTHTPKAQATLDYAPGAQQQNVEALAEADSTDPTDLDLSPTASYGDAFTFEATGEKTSRITVDVTPSSLEITAGEQESFAVRLTNDADGSDEVSLTLGNTPPGWSANLDKSTVTVPAHGSEVVTLYISPSEDAEGHELVHLKATSERGADKGASVSVIASQPEDPGGDDPGEDPDENAGTQDPAEDDVDETSEETEPSPEEEADEVPLPSPIAGLAAMLAAAFILRVRR